MNAVVVVDSARNMPRPMPVDKALARRAEAETLPEYLQRDEIHRMADAAERERDRLLILALWNTGGRVSEVLALRRCDLDAAAGVIRLVNLKQHHAAAKVVYISVGFALEFLAFCEQNGIRGTDYVFTAKHTGRRLSRQSAWKIVHQVAERAGVRKPNRLSASPHQARHGAAIQMLRDGVPLKIVSTQLGHSSVLVTAGFYNEFSAADRREFINRVNF